MQNPHSLLGLVFGGILKIPMLGILATPNSACLWLTLPFYGIGEPYNTKLTEIHFPAED